MPTADADAPNLQRRVYDVAVAATECNQTQAHCAREANAAAWRCQATLAAAVAA